MPAKVTLEITQGPHLGDQWVFEEHDTFLFGRMQDCHVHLPHDKYVSRYHFILEANPPDARVLDLGSLNGTHVNGVKQGGRQKGETPEEGAEHQYPEVDLGDGDEVRVGDTIFRVCVDLPVECVECGVEIAEDAREKAAWVGDTFICDPCRKKLEEAKQPKLPPKPKEPVRCRKCGKDVSKEIGAGRRGDYVCLDCQRQALADPSALLMALLQDMLGQEAQPELKLDLPDYDIVKELGRGGMGAVYLVRHKHSGRQEALKVMLPRVAVDEQSKAKFLREIDTMGKLEHGNIAEMHEHGVAGGVFYFLMEFCPGGGVDSLVRKHGGRLTLAQAGPVMLQSLAGLAFAHENSYIHRDLKPQNILLAGREGNWTAKIADLGLGKNFDEAGLSGHTRTGEYAGTKPFMPREQVINFKYAKPVTDVWAMGATLYNMLSGRYPYDFPRGKDPIQIILKSPVVPIRKRGIRLPRRVEEVLNRSLAVKVSERYQDAGEMRRALAQVL